MNAFHDERYARSWQGRHLLHGRKPRAGDLVLQSNDYLAISRHPSIIEAQQGALADHGSGMMMSAVFFSDKQSPLHTLEGDLAAALGFEAGILTQSGFAANVGLMQSIASEHVPVYIDVLAHASIWEGIASSGARAIPILHNDLVHLERQILRNGAGVIAVDAVYSTNGSLSPLDGIADLAGTHKCTLIVDESHSLGTHGDKGQGLVASLNLQDRVHFVTASLAKAYCSRAGFIASNQRFKEYFTCESLPAIFSSSLLPHDIAGIQATHHVVQTEPWRRTRLHAITHHVRENLCSLGYPINEGSEQIIAFEAGPELATGRVRDILEEFGIMGSVFCAPATAMNRSLLRLTLHAGMTDQEVETLISACSRARRDLDIPSWSASRRAARSAQPDLNRK